MPHDLMIETKHDWQKLERLATFNLRFWACEVVICNGTMIVLPAPMKFIVQRNTGELACEAGSVILIELTPDHPVVDLLLVDRRVKDTEVYYVKASFSQYSELMEKKWREHLATSYKSNPE